MPEPRTSATPTRILVVASEAVSAGDLREATGDQAQGAEVLVIAPALQSSALRFWTSDTDDAIERAWAVQKNSVRKLEAGGVDATGDTGEADPILAIEDSLGTFEPDRIVVFHHGGDDLAYREDALLEGLQARFGLPVESRTVSGSTT